MEKNWEVEVKVNGLSKKQASRLFKLLMDCHKVYPASIASGSMAPAVDWETERAAIWRRLRPRTCGGW
jgi:hypothetical protein